MGSNGRKDQGISLEMFGQVKRSSSHNTKTKGVKSRLRMIFGCKVTDDVLLIRGASKIQLKNPIIDV